MQIFQRFGQVAGELAGAWIGNFLLFIVACGLGVLAFSLVGALALPLGGQVALTMASTVTASGPTAVSVIAAAAQAAGIFVTGMATWLFCFGGAGPDQKTTRRARKPTPTRAPA